MKERAVTLGLALGALALFWILMFPKPQGPPVAPRPMSTGADEEGYRALSGWLAAAGVPTLVLHRRFDQLGNAAGAPRSGNLLISTLPFGIVPHVPEYAALEAWVRAGNTLLILAALDDTPLWSAVSDNFVPQLQRLSALRFVTTLNPAVDPVTGTQLDQRAVMTPAGSEIVLNASGRFGLLEGVRRLATRSPLPSTQWQALATDSSPVLELARRADNAQPALWVKAAGDGAVIVSAYASLFSNRVIGQADNARLLSNIIGWSLKPGGRVIIDDAHQGAVDEYDAVKFFADPRLHHTLWWLVALWLAWVVAAQPLREAAPNAALLDESAMLRVTAGFFASVLRPVASAQWLLDEFFGRLRRRHGLAPSGAPPWEWLGSQAGVEAAALAQLRDFHARTLAGRRVSLVRLQGIISRISGQTS